MRRLEVQHLLTDSGFEVVRLETGELEEPHPEFALVNHMLSAGKLHQNYLGDGIYALEQERCGTTSARMALLMSVPSKSRYATGRRRRVRF